MHISTEGDHFFKSEYFDEEGVHLPPQMNRFKSPKLGNTKQRNRNNHRSTKHSTMENKFIPDAIDIVSKAITADNEGEYEQALNLYRDALGRFTMGLKYEKNEARKKLILERVEGYMKRAEELRDYVNKQNEVGGKGGTGGTGMKKKGDGDDDADDEQKKLRGALSGAVVTEKPNVKWDDVAGLEQAKDSLKEVCIIMCDLLLPDEYLLF